MSDGWCEYIYEAIATAKFLSNKKNEAQSRPPHEVALPQGHGVENPGYARDAPKLAAK
jgi:hypothetical protein